MNARRCESSLRCCWRSKVACARCMMRHLPRGAESRALLEPGVSTRQMASIDKVLIVGGGVGGMSLAICLAHQQRTVELIDLDPDWRAVGAGLSLNNASLRAFDRVGVLDQIRAHGDVHTGM